MKRARLASQAARTYAPLGPGASVSTPPRPQRGSLAVNLRTALMAAQVWQIEMTKAIGGARRARSRRSGVSDQAEVDETSGGLAEPSGDRFHDFRQTRFACACLGAFQMADMRP